MVECSSKLCEIITETICPLLGICTAYFIFLSPLKEIQSLRKNKGKECTLNPLPSIMVFCNCVSQTFYSFTIHNHWNYWPNFGGIIIGLYYVTVLYSSNLRPKDWNTSTFALLGFTLLNVIGGGLVFVLFDDDFDSAKLCMGIISIIILCGIYVSPLSTMVEVIRTKNSSSINFIMTVALFINGIFWTAYGIFYNDFFIWFPNALGILSSLTQFLLFLIFPKNSRNIDEDKKIPLYINVNKEEIESSSSSGNSTEKDISNESNDKDLSTVLV